jgi:hypothetical protein
MRTFDEEHDVFAGCVLLLALSGRSALAKNDNGNGQFKGAPVLS